MNELGVKWSQIKKEEIKVFLRKTCKQGIYQIHTEHRTEVVKQ